MSTKTEEAIELSNAAARLLSNKDLPVGARNLADVLAAKALDLLGGEQGHVETGEAMLCDLPAVLKLLGIESSMRGNEITFRITAKPEDPRTLNVTATVK